MKRHAADLSRNSLAATRWRCSWFFALVGSAVLLASSSARAQGFALDRYEPSERGSDWHANESLDLRGELRPALGVIGDWAYKPLVLYRDNEEVARIVEHQIFVHVGGAVVLLDRLRLGANLPLLVYSKGEAGTLSNTSFSTNEKTTVGDLRLSGDVRLFGVYGDPITMAFGVQGFVPTGSRDAFSGDGKVRIQPRLLAAGDIGSIAWAARVGFNYRALQDNVAGEPFGSELTFGAALGVRALENHLIVGPEVFGSTVVSDSGDGFFKRATTPLEILFGGKYRVTDDWRVGAGAGPGLTRGMGAPTVRVVASIEWFPEPEKKAEPQVAQAPGDRDNDGIADAQDACPDTPGPANSDPKKNGCPQPNDSDGDGITDDVDACPTVFGVANPDPKKHGCPAAKDSDGDGVPDDIDACPTEPGPANPDPKKNGCPGPKDSDGDGIPDHADACPTEAGPPDTDPAKNGCPRAKIEKGRILIMEQVQFETNKDIIKPESDPILQAVLKILNEHPEITKLSIEGHTDNRGDKAHNADLSKRRAAAVLKWLTGHGVADKRLTSNGFGQTKPLTSNATEEGRQQNRRVEFHIKEVDGKPAPQD